MCGSAAELCKKLRQEQAEMRDEAEHLNSEIRSLEADVRYSSHTVVLYVCMYVCRFVTRSPYSLSSHEACP